MFQAYILYSRSNEKVILANMFKMRVKKGRKYSICKNSISTITILGKVILSSKDTFTCEKLLDITSAA